MPEPAPFRVIPRSSDGLSPAERHGDPECPRLALFVCLACLGLAVGARAQGLLEEVRRYDLNDYALGISFWTGQNAYVGSDTSRVLYPYLTSFTHSAFTNDWLTLRGGDIGARYVVEDWEFGLTARVQTLGFGPDSRLALEGLSQRDWTLEAGPMIGWRGAPVHAQFRTYVEMPNTHDGTISELEFLAPVSLPRGYVVPSLQFSYLSSRYADHYFGVAPGEASPTRPTYEPGAVVNTRFGLTLGYRLAPKWLLQLSAGLEWLDEAVSASPIIERDRILSGSLSLAYNSDVFERMEAGDDWQRSIEFRVSLLDGRIDSRIKRLPSVSAAGETLSLEDIAGDGDRRSTLKFESFFRTGRYHRFEFGWIELDWNNVGTVADEVTVGETVVPAGAALETSLFWQSLRIGYGYSLIRDGQKELGVAGGLSFARIDLDLTELDSGQGERFRLETPLPTIGVFGKLPIAGSWAVGAEIRLFALDFDEYSGYSGFAGLTVEKRLGKAFGVGLGYDLYALRLEAKEDALRGTLRFRTHGPRLFLAWSF